MFIFLNAIRYSKDSIFFITTVIPSLVPILEKFKFHLLPRGFNDTIRRISIIPVNVPNVVHQYFSNSGIVGATSVLVTIYRFILEKRLAWRYHRFEVRLLTKAGNEFDDLWERTRNLFKNTNVRTTAVIQWYCFGESICNKVLFGAYFDNNLTGYGIFNKLSNDRFQILECLDLWVDPAFLGTIESLLYTATKYAKQKGLDAVSIPHFSADLGLKLKSMWLRTFKRDERNDFYLANDEITNNLKEHAYFVRAQGDIGMQTS